VVTRQLQVERRTEKVRRPKTDVLPLSHATNRLVSVLDGVEILHGKRQFWGLSGLLKSIVSLCCGVCGRRDH